MSIRVRGSITVQRKTSARGAFNVGDLSTEIGEFEVKDHLIEEFEPGKYAGDFIIKWIAPDSFSWRGRVFVKNRATLDAIFIDDAAEGSPTPMSPPEPDPLDETRAPTRPDPNGPAHAQGQQPAPQVQTQDDPDLGLFGDELHALVIVGDLVKLDPTVDRERFRLQRDRLKEIGYQFDARAQSWRRTAQS